MLYSVVPLTSFCPRGLLRGMSPKPLVKLLALSWLAALVLASTPLASAAPDPNDPNPPVVSLRDNTYKLTRGSSFAYFRDTTKLAKRARADAEKFCADMGKKMQEVSMEEKRGGLVLSDFSKATITFKALDPNDPAFLEAKA